jgi:hypothetical protein
MSEIHKNIFAGGLDQDTAYPNVSAQNYVDSVNLSLVGDGKFSVLQNIKGTTKISDIVAVASTDVIAIYENTYQIGATQNVNCITVFTATQGGNFKIFCLDVDNNVLYQLYQEAVASDYFTNDRVMDCISYAERGYDILFFTDNYNEVRKLRCVIPVGYTPNFLKKTEIGLTRRNAIGIISLVALPTTGSLLTGTYQLAYQLINTTTNKATGFSLLTNPIHVYTTINGYTYAGVGMPSTKAIQINITPTSDELSNYTHFRVAVVENTNPEGVVSTEIGLSKIEAISTYLSGSVITNYIIKDNAQLDTTTLDNITIDLAAIEKVKTLTIANNRLVLGNVQYRNLTYNNGTPSITGGSIIAQVGTADSFSSDLFTSQFKGHFREEVYRYAISYFDEFGNYSEPSTIDVSAITNNQISGGLKDMKFPSRNQAGGIYSIMDASSNTKSLGLSFTAVNNHPTWARGFVILRAKRKKNIAFQTPYVIMSRHVGLGATEKYPTIVMQGTGAGTATTYAAATPMGPSEVFFPQNLFYGTRVQMRSYASNGGAALNAVYIGEPFLAQRSDASYIMLFPDSTMYSLNSKYSFTNTETLQYVDSAILRLFFTRFDSTGINCGSSVNTSCSGSFFASLNGDYYFNHGNAKANIAVGGVQNIAATKNFDNYASGDLVNGAYMFDTTKLTTGGINLGYVPNTNRCVVAKLSVPDNDYYSGLTYSSGVPVNVPVGGAPAFFPLNTNDFITSTPGLYGSYVNALPIVNVTTGLTDARYGQIQDYNEFLFTGTKVVFSDAELITVAAGGSLPKTVSVWGGDCIVSPHCFKISDTVYSVMNQEKAVVAGQGGAAQLLKWTKTWLDLAGNCCMMVPIGLKSASQYITVVLESEYHGSVRDVDTSEFVGTYNFPIRGAVTESAGRAAQTYNNNINLKQENDQKLFIPTDPTQPVTTQYKARFLYSDLKVYQTNVEGFNSFPVGNIYDLPEKYGALTKIQVSKDAMYAVQLKGIAYVPVGEKIVELSDASQLGVRTGDIFGRYLYITTKGGSQHLKSIVNTGDSLFVFDDFNKSIYNLDGPNLIDITPGIMSTSRSNYFLTSIPEKRIVGFYDQVRDEYWIANNDGSFCLVFNKQIKKWISNYTLGAGFNGCVYTNNKVYAIGQNGSNYAIESFYTGNPTQFFGAYATSVYVDFIVNPMPETGKVFDDILLTASDRLNTLNIITEREAALGNQTITGITLDVTTRAEGNYRAKILRDSSGARLRGIYAKGRINWKTGVGNSQVSLYSINTKFRPSENTF